MAVRRAAIAVPVLPITLRKSRAAMMSAMPKIAGVSLSVVSSSCRYDEAPLTRVTGREKSKSPGPWPSLGLYSKPSPSSRAPIQYACTASSVCIGRIPRSRTRNSAPISTARMKIIGNIVFFFRNCIIAILLSSLNMEIIVAIDHQQ